MLCRQAPRAPRPFPKRDRKNTPNPFDDPAFTLLGSFSHGGMLSVVDGHVTGGELSEIKQNLYEDIRTLFPSGGRPDNLSAAPR